MWGRLQQQGKPACSVARLSLPPLDIQSLSTFAPCCPPAGPLRRWPRPPSPTASTCCMKRVGTCLGWGWRWLSTSSCQRWPSHRRTAQLLGHRWGMGGWVGGGELFSQQLVHICDMCWDWVAWMDFPIAS